MLSKDRIRTNIILTIIATVIFPIVCSYLLSHIYPTKFINIPLHSGLEVSGGVVAIVISMIFYLKHLKELTLTHFNYSSIAILSMGIIDIFHGLVMPGEMFVWLHSTALFFGGMFFISIWLKQRQVSKYVYKLVPAITISFSVIFSLFSILNPNILPAMISADKTFTATANMLNIIGGFGFFIASLKFLREYVRTKAIEELLFAGHTMLFGVAGILFVSSVIWDTQWWLWHFLRLLAYVMALYFLYIEFDKDIRSIETTNKKLENKNKEIQKYLSIVDKNIITSSTDLEGRITHASEAFCKISGYEIDELIGQKHNIVYHHDMPDSVYEEMWNSLRSNDSWHGVLNNKRKDGTCYWVDVTISPIMDEKGNKIGYTAIRHDITDKKKIEEISITDGLTGIYNRRHFNEIFPKMINDTKRSNEAVCFLIMDIDHFKQYNDTYGHQEGDKVLIQVAKTIKESLNRDGDICFRLGGEEFGVLFKSAGKEEAVAFANSFKEKIEKLNIEHSGNSVKPCVTVSIGLVLIDKNSKLNEDTFFKEADDLLYKAKKSGRNRVCSF